MVTTTAFALQSTEAIDAHVSDARHDRSGPDVSACRGLYRESVRRPRPCVALAGGRLRPAGDARREPDALEIWAHVSWFFETFLLEPNLTGYRSSTRATACCSIRTTTPSARSSPAGSRPPFTPDRRRGLSLSRARRRRHVGSRGRGGPRKDRRPARARSHHEQQHQSSSSRTKIQSRRQSCSSARVSHHDSLGVDARRSTWVDVPGGIV